MPIYSRSDQGPTDHSVWPGPYFSHLQQPPYTPCLKINCTNFLCQNVVKCPSILIIFGRWMTNRLGLGYVSRRTIMLWEVLNTGNHNSLDVSRLYLRRVGLQSHFPNNLQRCFGIS